MGIMARIRNLEASFTELGDGLPGSAPDTTIGVAFPYSLVNNDANGNVSGLGNVTITHEVNAGVYGTGNLTGATGNITSGNTTFRFHNGILTATS